MGRASVRAAIVAWFTGQVPGLNVVRGGKLRNLPAGDFAMNAGLNYAASAYVYIESVVETRVTGPAGVAPNAGLKRLDYVVGLVYLFKSKLRDSANALGDYDTFVEAVKARLRADPRLGQPDTVIWQAGQKLLEDLSDDAKYDATTQNVWGVVRFDVTEWINA